MLMENAWLFNSDMKVLLCSDVDAEELLKSGYTYNKNLFEVLGIEFRHKTLKDLNEFPSLGSTVYLIRNIYTNNYHGLSL